jgi:hypothetical protein
MLKQIFSVLIVLQFLVIALHDWLEIPGWTQRRQLVAALGWPKMILGSLIGAAFPGVAAGVAIYFWNSPAPARALDYWVIYCAITVASAIGQWWVPYFRGAPEKTKRMYATLYAGTIHVLPARGDNPRPNLLHLYFHTLFLTTFVLAVLLWAGFG